MGTSGEQGSLGAVQRLEELTNSNNRSVSTGFPLHWFAFVP